MRKKSLKNSIKALKSSKKKSLNSPHGSKIGFFGGTFDPVHNGHLRLAKTLASLAELDEVWFCPAFINPLKKVPGASSADRVAMLKLALKGTSFKVIEDEIDRKGVSFTIHTLRELISKNPSCSFRLLLGADLLAELPQWKEADELVKLAPPLVGERDQISSTEVRRRLLQGQDVSDLIPKSVLEYIECHGLYRS